MTRLDDLRARLPEFGFALYAIDPGGPVTLEVIDPTGAILTYRADTAEDVIDLAFPPEDDAPPAPVEQEWNVLD